MPGFNICGSGDGPDAKKRDIYRDYRWELSSINVPAFNSGNYKDGIDLEYLNLVYEFTLPSIDFDIEEIQGMSAPYKFPKKPNFPNIDATFYDYGELQQQFETWREKIWDFEKGLYSVGDDADKNVDFKGTMIVKLLSYNNEPARVYTLEGVWPKKISHSKLSMTNNALKTFTVDFVYDYYTVK